MSSMFDDHNLPVAYIIMLWEKQQRRVWVVSWSHLLRHSSLLYLLGMSLCLPT